MKHITCIEDLRELHRRKVPKAFFDYADRGSYAEETLRANRDDLQQIKFRQRILVDISQRDLSTTILGEKAALPLILAPVGSTGMQYGDGEIHACRAAQAAGIPFTLSTMSICSIEDVAAQCRQAVLVSALRHEGPRLRQGADRARHRGQMQRAGADRRSAGDRAAPSDIKNGMSVPPQWSARNMLDIATKPAWVAGMLRGKRRNFGNIAGHRQGHARTSPRWRAGSRRSSIRR